MYVILVYDVGEKRVGKMLKHCRKFVNWIQNSVFEGELTEVQLRTLIYGAKKIMDTNSDSLIIFKSREQKWLEKEVVGVEKVEVTNIL